MKGSKPKSAIDGTSRRMKVAIIAMLVLILLPSMMMSLPLSKIVITVSNMDARRTASGYLDLHGAGGGFVDFDLLPGQELTISFQVGAGTHDVRLQYWYAENQSSVVYGQQIQESYSLWPFETEAVKFNLAISISART